MLVRKRIFSVGLSADQTSQADQQEPSVLGWTCSVAVISWRLAARQDLDGAIDGLDDRTSISCKVVCGVWTSMRADENSGLSRKIFLGTELRPSWRKASYTAAGNSRRGDTGVRPGAQEDVSREWLHSEGTRRLVCQQKENNRSSNSFDCACACAGKKQCTDLSPSIISQSKGGLSFPALLLGLPYYVCMLPLLRLSDR